MKDWSPDGKLLLFNLNLNDVFTVPTLSATESSVSPATNPRVSRWALDRLFVAGVRPKEDICAELTPRGREVADLDRVNRTILAPRQQRAVFHGGNKNWRLWM